MRKYLGLTALAAVFALGGAWGLTRGADSDGLVVLPGAAVAQEDTAQEDTAQTPAPEIDITTIQDMAIGAADAPVTVIEYGSFTCGHCANFHANQLVQLKADYVDTGKVRFIFREVYFDRFGLWASMIARCGGEMRFFGIHDVLYDTQADWIAGGQDAALIADNLRTIGIAAGMEAEQVDACMRDETMAQTLVAWFQANATADGIDATPTLIIDGEKHSNMAYEDLAALIEEALAD